MCVQLLFLFRGRIVASDCCQPASPVRLLHHPLRREPGQICFPCDFMSLGDSLSLSPAISLCELERTAIKSTRQMLQRGASAARDAATAIYRAATQLLSKARAEAEHVTVNRSDVQAGPKPKKATMDREEKFRFPTLNLCGRRETDTWDTIKIAANSSSIQIRVRTVISLGRRWEKTQSSHMLSSSPHTEGRHAVNVHKGCLASFPQFFH